MTQTPRADPGHISWLCGLGLTRSLTVAYPALKSNFSGSTTVVGLFTTLILLGNSIGAPFSVFLMKYIGLRRQTMLAGVLYAGGFVNLVLVVSQKKIEKSNTRNCGINFPFAKNIFTDLEPENQGFALPLSIQMEKNSSFLTKNVRLRHYN